MPFDFLYHEALPADLENPQKYKKLYAQGPTAKNYANYYELGCFLWRLDRLDSAAHVFEKIVSSKSLYYDTIYHYSAGCVYGYGSYSYHYKNSASIYLAKIALLHKQYKEALNYLSDAREKYAIAYSCGTGARYLQDEYDFLAGSCYEGLSRYSEAIDLLLPHALERGDQIVIRAIRKSYSPGAIRDSMAAAEASIVFTPDTVLSTIYSYSGSDTAQKGDILNYYSGSATIRLFGHEVAMQIPRPEYINRVERTDIVKEFKDSGFYYALSRKVAEE